jgi:hypothetical protein
MANEKKEKEKRKRKADLHITVLIQVINNKRTKKILIHKSAAAKQ